MAELYYYLHDSDNNYNDILLSSMSFLALLNNVNVYLYGSSI